MNNSNTFLQTTLAMADDAQLQKTWAFATRERFILSCSKEARNLGIKVGMRYDDAKTLLPDMRILVIGGQN